MARPIQADPPGADPTGDESTNCHWVILVGARNNKHEILNQFKCIQICLNPFKCSFHAKSKLYCGPNGPTASIFYGIWIKQSVGMVFIVNLDKVLLKKFFPTMNI